MEAVLPDTSSKAYEIRGLGQKTQGFGLLWTWVVNEQTLPTSELQKTLYFYSMNNHIAYVASFLFYKQIHWLR